MKKKIMNLKIKKKIISNNELFIIFEKMQI